MFFVKPTDVQDVMSSLSILSSFNVNVTIKAIDPESQKASNYTFMVDDIPGTDTDDLRLAEMAFQMSFRQCNKVCPVCKEAGDEFCGHLTFTKALK